MVTCVKNKFQLKKICYFWFMGSKMTREGTLAPEAIGQCIWSNMYHSFIFKVKGAYFKDVGAYYCLLTSLYVLSMRKNWKNPKKPEKARKNPKKPEKTRKNPLGWVLSIKPGFFPTLIYQLYILFFNCREFLNDSVLVLL